MAAATKAPTFPRRDARGHVETWAGMLGGVGFGIAAGTVVLAVIDGIFAVLGAGGFGHISGWLAGILPVWMFIEDFRAWRIGPGKIGVALLAAAIGVVAGAAVSARLTSLPNVFAGAIGVLVACVIYVAIWFFGVRALAGRIGER